MLLNPCRKCVVKVMCSQKCDDKRKWNNILRIWKNTFKNIAYWFLTSIMLIFAFAFFVRCMGMMKQ